MPKQTNILTIFQNKIVKIFQNVVKKQPLIDVINELFNYYYVSQVYS